MTSHGPAKAGRHVLMAKAGRHVPLAIDGIAIAALVLAASVSAITPPTVKLTDTKLKSGLRVNLENGLHLIVLEDHRLPQIDDRCKS